MPQAESQADLSTFYTNHLANCQVLEALDEAGNKFGDARLRIMQKVRAQIARSIDRALADLDFFALIQQMEERWRQTAIELSRLLPVISEPQLRRDCIYRGGLLRNLKFADEPVDLQTGFKIENLALRLNPGTLFNMVDFTGLSGQEIALNFALKGFVGDDRTREDAVVIEAPFDLVNRLMRVPEGRGKISVLPNLFREHAVRVFKPVRSSK